MTQMSYFISPMVFRTETVREGRGFSLAEIQAAGLNAGEAKIIGIPVDLRRKSTHEENVEILKEYITAAKENEIKIPKPKQTSKGQRGRAQRSVTKAGHKSRGI
ncbi:TPA: ribosomal protein L13e [Candidatus Bathyarchaeota archaeon]|nr:ribosomal protein L13e [Candidatus Bathyarchaeota archaeon]